jgi:hypothetical protein
MSDHDLPEPDADDRGPAASSGAGDAASGDRRLPGCPRGACRCGETQGGRTAGRRRRGVPHRPPVVRGRLRDCTHTLPRPLGDR